MNDLLNQVKKQLDQDNRQLFIEILEDLEPSHQLEFIIKLNSRGLLDLSQDLRLLLFNKIFNSGFLCYVPYNTEDFKANYDQLSPDLGLIASIVSCPTLKELDKELNSIYKDFYMVSVPEDLEISHELHLRDILD